MRSACRKVPEHVEYSLKRHTTAKSCALPLLPLRATLVNGIKYLHLAAEANAREAAAVGGGRDMVAAELVGVLEAAY